MQNIFVYIQYTQTTKPKRYKKNQKKNQNKKIKKNRW